MVQDGLDLASLDELFPIKIRTEDASGKDHASDLQIAIARERVPEKPGSEAVGDDVWPPAEALAFCFSTQPSYSVRELLLEPVSSESQNDACYDFAVLV